MFRKIVFLSCLSISLFGNGYTFGCLCDPYLSPAYENIDTFINEQNLIQIKNNIDNVESTLDENISKIEEETLLLKELNRTMKLEIAQLHEYNEKVKKYNSVINSKLGVLSSEYKK